MKTHNEAVAAELLPPQFSTIFCRILPAKLVYNVTGLAHPQSTKSQTLFSDGVCDE
jgi:hypothetical protein